jgi:hypothetical protein
VLITLLWLVEVVLETVEEAAVLLVDLELVQDLV